jgi:hypothetical protein
MGTVRTSVVGAAFNSASVATLNARTSGWSISKTTVPAGQARRYPRASSPDARITTWRMPASHASVRNLSKYRVRAVSRSVICCMPHHEPGTSTSAAASSPLAQRVKKSTPTARTRGSAKRSSMRLALVARALPAATIVAVAPTLVARSQVSSSVRSALT